jgi:hypothetical protein
VLELLVGCTGRDEEAFPVAMTRFTSQQAEFNLAILALTRQSWAECQAGSRCLSRLTLLLTGRRCGCRRWWF